MTPAQQLARQYVDLSNASRLEAIGTLFTPSSTYSSVNTGVYLGVDQIMAMQTAFFAGFKCQSWDTDEWVETNHGVVRFDFTFQGVTLKDETVRRTGVEYVVVYQDHIVHVEVRDS